MTDQQHVEATPSTPPPAAETPPATESQDPAPTRTADSVEAEWKNRVSSKERYFAATEKSLRDQIASLEAGQETAQKAADGNLSEVDALKAQLKAEKDARKQEKANATATLRTTKYPEAASTLDVSTLASMDEAKLAGLEARLTQAPTPAPVDPSTPPRATAAPESTDKSAADLKADLERLSPDFAASLRE